jgi:hypothetical protein
VPWALPLQSSANPLHGGQPVGCVSKPFYRILFLKTAAKELGTATSYNDEYQGHYAHCSFLRKHVKLRDNFSSACNPISLFLS